MFNILACSTLHYNAIHNELFCKRTSPQNTQERWENHLVIQLFFQRAEGEAETVK